MNYESHTYSQYAIVLNKLLRNYDIRKILTFSNRLYSIGYECLFVKPLKSLDFMKTSDLKKFEKKTVNLF